MRFRPTFRREDAIPRLSLIAFIDVVLFILLYFMMAGNLATPESELASALQTARGDGASRDLAPQVVQVDVIESRPVFLVGERVIGDRESLTAVLKQLNKEAGVFVKVMGRAPVGSAAAAMQACRDAGFVKVSYVPAGAE